MSDSKHVVSAVHAVSSMWFVTQRRALEINSSRPPVSPQQLHSRGASLAGTPMGGASLAGGHPFRRGEAAEDPGHTTDLSVAYSLARRSTSFSGGRPTAEILVRPFVPHLFAVEAPTQAETCHNRLLKPFRRSIHSPNGWMLRRSCYIAINTRSSSYCE